jgi:hypothetical protein
VTVIRPLTRQIRRDMERHKRSRIYIHKDPRTKKNQVWRTGFAYTCAQCPAPITAIEDACLIDGHVSHRVCPDSGGIKE